MIYFYLILVLSQFFFVYTTLCSTRICFKWYHNFLKNNLPSDPQYSIFHSGRARVVSGARPQPTYRIRWLAADIRRESFPTRLSVVVVDFLLLLNVSQQMLENICRGANLSRVCIYFWRGKNLLLQCLCVLFFGYFVNLIYYQSAKLTDYNYFFHFFCINFCSRID